MRDRRFGRRLGAIAALALAARVTYVLAAKRHQALLGDAIYYEGQAHAIAEGRFFDAPFAPGHPAADHPPLTALLLAPVARLAPGNLTAMRLLLCLVGTVTVVLVGLLGRQVARSRRRPGDPPSAPRTTPEKVGLVAAGLAAVYPGLWVNDGVLMAEAPAGAAVAAVLLLAYLVRERPTALRAAAVGALVGVAALTRAELVLLGPLVAAPALLAPFWRARAWRRAAAVLAVGTAGALVVVGPWVGWNLVRFERPTFLSTGQGHVVAGANCPAAYYGPGLGFWSLDCAFLDPDAPVDVDQSELAAWYQERGEAYRDAHLGRLPVVIAARVGRVWSVWRPGQMTSFNQQEGRERWASDLALVTFWILVPVAAAGAVLARRRHLVIWPLLAPPVLVTLVAAWYYGLVRLRVPAEVSLVTLAAITLVAAGSGRGRGRAAGARATPTSPARPPD